VDTLFLTLISNALFTMIGAIGRNGRQATEIRNEQLHLRNPLAGGSVSFVHFVKAECNKKPVCDRLTIRGIHDPKIPTSTLTDRHNFSRL
jgi:hypothetical protein